VKNDEEAKMPKITSIEELKRLREEALQKRQAKTTSGRVQITVLMGTCGIAAGAREAMKAILEVIETQGLRDILVKQAGCIGLCEYEPIVEVEIVDEPKVRYGRVSAELAVRIMQEHVLDGQPVSEFAIPLE
jgi:NADP-reducing hydrogenase subunit HndB